MISPEGACVGSDAAIGSEEAAESHHQYLAAKASSLLMQGTHTSKGSLEEVLNTRLEAAYIHLQSNTDLGKDRH